MLSATKVERNIVASVERTRWMSPLRMMNSSTEVLALHHAWSVPLWTNRSMYEPEPRISMPK